MKSHTPNVSIVIPNWNGKHLLEKFLPSVLAAAGNAEIVVSDDGSSDGSVSWLRQSYPGISVIGGTGRSGFAGNINRGVAASHGDVIVLLNTDVSPDKGFLVPLLKRFSDPNIAAVGCLEKSSENGSVVERGRGVARWVNGFYIHSRGETDSDDTAWVSGGSGAFRRSVWDKLGGMDELFNPFYWEDIDLSYRIRKAGYRITFERRSVVSHFHEEGKIRTAFRPWQVSAVAYRNQFLFHWKNVGDSEIMRAHVLWLPVRLLQAVTRGDIGMIVGFFAAVMRFPAVLAARKAGKRFWRRHDSDLLPVN